jgi:hypothetical protein
MIDTFYNIVKPYFGASFNYHPANGDEVCYCCERRIADTLEPAKIMIEKDSYGMQVTRCLPCQSLFTGAKSLLGERPKGRLEFAVEKTILSASILDIASNENLTKIQKTKSIKKIAVLYPANKYYDSLPSQLIYLDRGESVFIKNEFLAQFTKKQKTSSLSQIKKWLHDDNAIISKAEHLRNIDEMDFTLLCINEGGAEVGKFGMLAGAGMVITDKSAVMYAPGKHFQNIAAIDGFPFQLVPVGGAALINDVLERFKDVRPLLVISSFGKKKAVLVKNLRQTKSIDELIVCSDDEQLVINIPAYKALIAFFESKDKKTSLDTIQMIRRLVTGADTPVQAKESLSGIDGVQSLLKQMPDDPHETVILLRLISQIIG